MTEEFLALFAEAGVELRAEDWEYLERLRELVIEGNRRMNLTRLVEPRDFYLKHVLDSILPLVRVPRLRALPAHGVMVADLGSGAGFPGLAWAGLRPGWEFALIERTQKKAAFLEETKEALGLSHVYVVPLDAAEAAGRVPALRRGCHVVLARAVGRIGPVTTAAAPLLAPGAMLLHYKGGSVDPDELSEGATAARRLGIHLEAPIPYDLPPDAHRTVVPALNRSTGRKRGGARRPNRARRQTPGDTS